MKMQNYVNSEPRPLSPDAYCGFSALFVSESHQMVKRLGRPIERITPATGFSPPPGKIMTWLMRAFVRGLPRHIG